MARSGTCHNCGYRTDNLRRSLCPECWFPRTHPLLAWALRRWFVHNVIAHPASEILYWVGQGDLGNRLHDATLPLHEAGTGRG